MVYYYLFFFCLSKLIISGFLQIKGNFERGQNNSKYRDWAPLNVIKFMFLHEIFQSCGTYSLKFLFELYWVVESIQNEAIRGEMLVVISVSKIAINTG